MSSYLILIPIYNNHELTKRCLESLIRCHVPGEEYRVILVDNASDPPIQNDWSTSVLNLEVIPRDENVGYGLAINSGIEYSSNLWDLNFDYLVVLNNDVEVCEGWLATMTKKAEAGAAQVGILAPGFGNHLDPSGLGKYQLSLSRSEYAEGSCFLMPLWAVKERIKAIGALFDPIYHFAYFEDADLSLWLRSQGYRVDWAAIPMKHEGQATTKVVQETVDLHGYFMRNWDLFRRRWSNYLKTREFIEERVLFVRKVGLGDVLRLTPIIRAYKEKYPRVKIDVATYHPQVFQDNPYVNELISPQNEAHLHAQELYSHIYDVNLAPERRKGVPVHEAYAQAVGITLKDPSPELYHPDWAELFSKIHQKANKLRWSHKYQVVLSLGEENIGGRDGRAWPKEYFRTVAQYFLTQGWQVIELGKDTPSLELEGTTDLRNQTTLHEALAVIYQCNLFIGEDSALSNLAMARPIDITKSFTWSEPKMIVLFGCQEPDRVMIPAEGRVALQADIGCKSCLVWSGELRQVKCFRQDHKNLCMDKITPEMVIKEAIKLLGAKEVIHV